MIIDCDCHHHVHRREDWFERMDEPYRSEVLRMGFRTVSSGLRYEDGGSRWDAVPAEGVPSSDPHFTKKQLLDEHDITYALLSGWTPWAGVPDPDYADALIRAFNDATIDVWLPADERYRFGIHVPLQDPQLAAAEVRRLGEHPKAIAVCFFATANRIPFGQRYYWPIYEACCDVDLPIHVHPSTPAVIANAASGPAGPVTTYLESHCVLPTFYMHQVASLVLEGTFERFPKLRFAMVEGGLAWLPHLLWRMDKEFRSLRQQAPRLRRLPSEYVRDHVRFTTQPLEEPQQFKHLQAIFEMVDAEHTVMYASDYPHFDFDPPTVLSKRLGAGLRDRILYDNAAEFFGLPARKAEAACPS